MKEKIIEEPKSLAFLGQTRPSNFGDSVFIPMPEGCSMVLIGLQTENGMYMFPHPMLSGQLYIAKLEQILNSNPNVTGVVAIPVNTNHYHQVVGSVRAVQTREVALETVAPTEESEKIEDGQSNTISEGTSS